MNWPEDHQDHSRRLRGTAEVVTSRSAKRLLDCGQFEKECFMLAIVYISSAVHPFSEADLTALLKQSQQKNAELEITGIMLYRDGDVMQLLEGPEEAVKKLAKTIYADPRHSGIIQLVEQKISRREFPDWSMEFQNLGALRVRQLAKFMNQQSAALTSETERLSPILRLLASFGMHKSNLTS
jgi:acylphosphatase